MLKVPFPFSVKKMLTILFFFLLCGKASFSFTPPIHTDVLFILYDAGETFGLYPVFQELDKQNVDYRILLTGPAQKIDLVTKHPKAIDVNEECGIASQIVHNLGWTHLTDLDFNEVEMIYHHISCNVVVSGMVSKLQQQILNRYAWEGVRTMAFYDRFRPIEENDIGNLFFDNKTEFLIPAHSIAKEISEFSPESQIYVVGLPTIERWVTTVSKVNKYLVYSRLGLSGEKKVILFIGGYGEGYVEAFHTFAQMAEERTDCDILVAIHPIYGGTVEREVLLSYDCEHVKLLHRNGTVMGSIACPTEEAVALADVIVNWQSTAGVHVKYMGKSLFYIEKKNTSFRDLALDAGVRKVSNKEAALAELDYLLHNTQTPHYIREVPAHSAQVIAQLIMESQPLLNLN